jgi:hypothetical protein
MTSRICSTRVFQTIVVLSGLTGCSASDSPPKGNGDDTLMGAGTGGIATLPGGGGAFGVGTGGTAPIPASGSGGVISASAGGALSNSAGGIANAGAGTTGASGSSTVSGPVTIAPANSIDDLEDGDGSISALGGRVGAWYTYNDKTAGATQTPAAGDPFTPLAAGNGSAKAAQTTGSGFTTWGAGFGFDFNNTGTTKGTYPVAAFTGIVFSAKGTPFRLKVLTTGTVPAAEGGACATTKCGDNFGKAITATANWQQFAVPFASLTQEGWGDKVTFDGATVTGVQFQVAAKVAFDISIDDVGFY